MDQPESPTLTTEKELSRNLAIYAAVARTLGLIISSLALWLSLR